MYAEWTAQIETKELEEAAGDNKLSKLQAKSTYNLACCQRGLYRLQESTNRSIAFKEKRASSVSNLRQKKIALVDQPSPTMLKSQGSLISTPLDELSRKKQKEYRVVQHDCVSPRLKSKRCDSELKGVRIKRQGQRRNVVLTANRYRAKTFD
ncbi:hypothetical protein NECAME_02166 [Necator americanus]|uniref:Uncharacterized protein n=1 Tax=Necator americanus TaxID=51031 RepID=W2TJX9_NECAM|nr:hypothetical protein NECAME_02166 [Necator americanus]ETN81486.1 hypothetical protein NECAME_02166 [Necator americanus]